MKLDYPHIITEGNTTYRLGELKGNQVLYSFEKMLKYLEAKGKLMFGDNFKIYEEDHGLLLQLCNYMIRDYDSCKKYGLDPNKGLLLSGPVGCGKTSLMRLLKFLVPYQRPYTVIPSRNLVFGFNHIGYKTISDYGDGQYFCFDDLGVEPLGKHFGKDCNVMGEILLSRYELFVNHQVRTHCTTNLNAKELEERYGKRVRSRMRQMFNLVAFDHNSKDKRK
ncbi:ATPase [Flagellimonas lutimaris]|uniref:ATPase n=1 Tax=Flagellimonas lutimaris TaxID=475082 RepID=UPI0016027DEC|nr:ATPase [Allomuricauda lutimaris]